MPCNRPGHLLRACGRAAANKDVGRLLFCSGIRISALCGPRFIRRHLLCSYDHSADLCVSKMATGLNLPPPQHDAEHKNSEDASPSAAQRFATGQLILPPPSMRTLIDKTASYISRNGPGFEEVLRKTDSEKKENRLPFLHASDPYHAYYVQTLDRLRRGEPLEPVSLQAAQQPQLDQPTSEAVPEEPEDDIQPPPPFLFSADVPTTTAQDL